MNYKFHFGIKGNLSGNFHSLCGKIACSSDCAKIVMGKPKLKDRCIRCEKIKKRWKYSGVWYRRVKW